MLCVTLEGSNPFFSDFGKITPVGPKKRGGGEEYNLIGKIESFKLSLLSSSLSALERFFNLIGKVYF
jgi:hypothetical protein